MDYSEFDNDKTIDPGQLDIECVRQADLYFKWAQRSIAAKAEADRQKFQLGVLKANLQNLIRSKPEKFGITKTSEKAFESAVDCHPSFIKAYEDWCGAAQVASMLSEAVEAMQQKKSMLNLLVQLHGQQYFAGPSVPRDIVSDWVEYQRGSASRANERQASRVRRRSAKGGD